MDVLVHLATPADLAQGRRGQSMRTIAAALTLVLFASGATWILMRSVDSVDRGLPGPNRHVPSVEAHEAYVKGRYFLDERSITGWRQALEQFERAIVLDPQYPAAHRGLAATYSALSDFGVSSPAEMRPQAMRAAERALALNPQSAEGLAALARLQFLF